MSQQLQKKMWWEAPKGQVHKLVFETLQHWDTKQAHRTAQNLRHFRLYGNSEVLGLRLGEYQSLRSLNKLTLNVIQAASDTATAKIAKNKPKPMFLTEDGDFDLHRKANNLESYVNGNFYHMNLYQKGQMIFRDGTVFGDGLVHFFPVPCGNSYRLEAERVFPEEIKIDEDEAIHGDPRQLHRVKYITKAVACHLYPKSVSQIMESTAEDHSFMYDQYTPGMVKIVESWKLPSGPGAKDGRHTITVSKGDLLDEPYEANYYPFEKWSWNPHLLGWWSQGIAEQLTGMQIEINKILKTIQLSMHLGSVPKIFMEAGSRIVKAHLNNQVGGIIEYFGKMPEQKELMGVPKDLFLQLGQLYQQSFEMVGLSQMSIGSRKPSGLNSGKALREFNDIETERFAVVAQSWEDFYMRCSKKIIMMSKDMAKKYPNMSVTHLDKNKIRTIKWKDVFLEEDKFATKIYPTNLLSSTPAAKLEDVKELYNGGFLNKRQALALLDYPDLEAVTSLENAIVQDIEATIEGIIDRGEYSAPEEFQDLEYALPVMQAAYLKYKRYNLSAEKLELFARWIDDALLFLSPPEDSEPGEDPEDMAAVEEQMTLELLQGGAEQAAMEAAGAAPDDLGQAIEPEVLPPEM